MGDTAGDTTTGGDAVGGTTTKGDTAGGERAKGPEVSRRRRLAGVPQDRREEEVDWDP